MTDALERIAELQKERNWSNYRLAEEAGISLSTITNMYLRKTLPSLTTLDNICNAFGVTLEEFFRESPDASAQDSMVLSLYRRLSPRDKRTVIALMEQLNENP